MRNFIALLLVAFAAISASEVHTIRGKDHCGLRYDGLYIADHAEPDYKRYLRFYESGEVLVMESTSPLNEIAVWFKKEDAEITNSTFKVKNCKISFPIKVGDDKFLYEGSIDGSKLRMFKKEKDTKNSYEYNYSFKQLTFR